jgi:hypothetical protein
MACDARQPVSGSPLAPAQGLELSGRLPRGDQDQNRIASASDAPQRGCHCLTKMFPAIQHRLYPTVAQR